MRIFVLPALIALFLASPAMAQQAGSPSTVPPVNNQLDVPDALQELRQARIDAEDRASEARLTAKALEKRWHQAMQKLDQREHDWGQYTAAREKQWADYAAALYASPHAEPEPAKAK